MTHLKITGMTCDSCAAHVKEALERVPGVRSAVVSYPRAMAQLATEPGTSPQALTVAVAGLGYRAMLAEASPAEKGSLLDKALGWLGGGDKSRSEAGGLHIAIIGSGGAAMAAALKAVEQGAQVTLIERGTIGGTCVNVGCVPKKLLVQAGEYGAWADDAAGFGWTIKKGPHDWAKLLAAKDKEIGRLNGIYKRLLEGPGCKIFEATATFIDAHTLDVGGQRITAENIVIATGGAPERPAIPGAELAIISDDTFYLPEMPKKIAIVGSGFIAVEFAGIFQALGAEVHLIYRQPLPLRGFDEDLREGLAEAMAAQRSEEHTSELQSH